VNLGLLVLLALAQGACGSASPEAAWADSLQTMHDEARQLETAGKVDDALVVYQRAADLVPPSGSSRTVALRQDAHFALGRALLVSGKAEQALAAADRGLALGQSKTVFVANLHALRATALEASGRDLDAVADYEAALDIHEHLLSRALGDNPAPQAGGGS